MKQKSFAKVCIDSPLRKIFDYRIPDQLADINIGYRVLVPFGQRNIIGIVVGLTCTSDIASSRLKSIQTRLDNEAIFSRECFELIKWAARYYHYPLGAALFSALPPALRKTNGAEQNSEYAWQVIDTKLDELKRAPKQASILKWLLEQSDPVIASELNKQFPNSHAAINALENRGCIKKILQTACAKTNFSQYRSANSQIKLNDEQNSACKQIATSLKQFNTFLLEGVTGSGKTEVYFNIIDKILTQDTDAQILVLVPEIGLTPQLHKRLSHHFAIDIALLHSNTSEKQRKQTWLDVSAGKVRIILGTRLAVFTPIPYLSLIIVDEEHDASLKQQESFLYHARDVAIYRAKQLDIPIVLGSATPSFESLHNAQVNKFDHLHLHQRAHETSLPKIHLADMRTENSSSILSNPLRQAMHRHLQDGHQVILFLNRRGYSPALLCHDCGWVANCERCDANMTYHSQNDRLICHHCDNSRGMYASCPQCGSNNLIMLGHGTQRIEEILKNEFNQYPAIRLDRDITRRKGALETILSEIQTKTYQVIIGTQILSKGHDFPDVSLVGILDIDYGIHSSDFRALERSAQLLIQVAGRSGRRQVQGEVYVQTHTPDHPLLQTLINHGYAKFAQQALQTRYEWKLPPFSHHIAIRARSQKQEDLFTFLNMIKALAMKQLAEVITVQGPITAAMEKKAGQFRAYVLLTTQQRGKFIQQIDELIAHIETRKETRAVRWSIDVDPIDNFA